MAQENVGAFMQKMRREKGMTQKELADILHISDKTISKWETGKGIPDGNECRCHAALKPD